jgi:delta1-piperideine-2-carboxylate reductase
MKLTIKEASDLVRRTMQAIGHDEEEAAIITTHLIDCELRGQGYAGLARALSVVERIRKRPEGRKPIKIIRETPVSVLLDGGDQAGYLVGHRGTALAMEKAAAQGIGIAGVYNTWYTGMFAHYMEMGTKAGLIAMAAGSSDWRVAPSGSNEAFFGTNPIAFGFPSLEEPIIFDAGLSSIMTSQATLARRLREELPEGIAFDGNGNPTRDPGAALGGAFTVWGGHKGTGLGLCIQLFGLLCNGALKPDPLSDCSLFLMFMRPDLLIDEEVLRRQVSHYANNVRNARAIDASKPARMPFDRSAVERRRRLEAGCIDVANVVYEQLVAIVEAAER